MSDLVEPAIVIIGCLKGGQIEETGTGFFVSKKLIVTAAHLCIKGDLFCFDQKPFSSFQKGKMITPIKIDHKRDLFIGEVETANRTYFQVKTFQRAALPSCHLIGFPSEHVEIKNGLILRFDFDEPQLQPLNYAELRQFQLFQHDYQGILTPPSNGGMSGAPFTDDEGTLYGMHSANLRNSNDESDGINVSVNEIAHLLACIRQ